MDVRIFTIAWKPLLHQDYKSVNAYRKQAIVYYPELQESDNYKRLTFVTLAKQYLGKEIYTGLKSLASKLKKPLASAAQKAHS